MSESTVNVILSAGDYPESTTRAIQVVNSAEKEVTLSAVVNGVTITVRSGQFAAGHFEEVVGTLEAYARTVLRSEVWDAIQEESKPSRTE